MVVHADQSRDEGAAWEVEYSGASGNQHRFEGSHGADPSILNDHCLIVDAGCTRPINDPYVRQRHHGAP